MTAIRAAATTWQQPIGPDLVAGGYEECLKAGQSCASAGAAECDGAQSRRHIIGGSLSYASLLAHCSRLLQPLCSIPNTLVGSSYTIYSTVLALSSAGTTLADEKQKSAVSERVERKNGRRGVTSSSRGGSHGYQVRPQPCVAR